MIKCDTNTLKNYFDAHNAVCLFTYKTNKNAFKIMMAHYDMLEQSVDNMNHQSNLMRYLRYTFDYDFNISNYAINFKRA